MKPSSFEALVSTLEAGGVRYLVAGGLAVGAHGYLRFTKDVDIVIQLERAPPELDTRQGNAGSAVLERCASRDFRDVFVSEPFAFDEEYARALVTPLHDNLSIRFVSLSTLIRMKEEADRPQDRADRVYQRDAAPPPRRDT